MEFVLFLHVLLGAIWMGGAMYGESLVALSRKKGRDEYATTNVKVQVTNGTIYPIVVPLVAVTAAILIWQSDHLGWGDAWISAAFGIWLVGLVLGIAYFARKAKEYVGRLEADGVTDELIGDLHKTAMVARLDLLLLLVLLFLMIFKPGA